MKFQFILVFLLLNVDVALAQNDTIVQKEQSKTEQRIQEKDESQSESLFQIGNIALGALLGGLLSFLIQKVVIQGKINNDIERFSNQIEKKFDDEKKKLDEQFKSSINLRKEKIESWIEEHDKEDELIRNCSILIVGRENHSEVESLLSQTGFKSENIYTENDNKENVRYQILFINNENGFVKDDELLLKWVNEMPSGALAFYYSKPRTKLYPIEKLPKVLQKKVNYANSTAQIFGNLLNSIKFRKKLDDYNLLRK